MMSRAYFAEPFSIELSLSSTYTIKFTDRGSCKKTSPFSYDNINIKGELELVAKDDEYNMFYRLKNAELVKN